MFYFGIGLFAIGLILTAIGFAIDSDNTILVSLYGIVIGVLVMIAAGFRSFH